MGHSRHSGSVRQELVSRTQLMPEGVVCGRVARKRPGGVVFVIISVAGDSGAVSTDVRITRMLHECWKRERLQVAIRIRFDVVRGQRRKGFNPFGYLNGHRLFQGHRPEESSITLMSWTPTRIVLGHSRASAVVSTHTAMPVQGSLLPRRSQATTSQPAGISHASLQCGPWPLTPACRRGFCRGERKLASSVRPSRRM